MTNENAIEYLKEVQSHIDLENGGNTQKMYDAIDMAIKALENAPTAKVVWDNHKVACLLADMFGDTCACNYNGIDEWLPKKCDFANRGCPNVVGVACWEQFLKYRMEVDDEQV